MSTTKSKKHKPKGKKKPTTGQHAHHHKKGRPQHNHGFFGTPAKGKTSLKDTLIEVGKYVIFVAGGSLLGAVVGKPSLYLGLPVAVYAFYKKHHMLGAAAVAAMFTPVLVAPSTSTAGYDDMEGFDLKKFEEDAKARLTAYFKGIGEKFYLPKPKTQTQTPAIQLQPVTGLNGGEEVSYFINPNNMGEAPDMQSLDKIQEQIARLSAGSSANITGFDELNQNY